MRIMSHPAQREGRGAFQFIYRGYEISISNVFDPAEIAIFEDGDGPMVHDFNAPATMEGIMAAKEYIDRRADSDS